MGATGDLLAVAAAVATNRPPTARASVGLPNSFTGVVTGRIVASDRDRDPLTYAVPATSDKGGSVTINSTGSFVYTPTASSRHDAAAVTATTADKTDTFTATVDDGHGHIVAVPVTVKVAPANAKPTGVTVTDLFTNPNSGKVTGTITAVDADNDDFSITGPATTKKGAITYDSSTDSFTYVPTAAARQAASAPRATALAKTDSFKVTLSDGHGGTAAVTVKVNIAPLPGVNTPPTITSVAVAQPASDGTVTGTVTATDADRDALTYTGTTVTANGKVVVNADGTFTFTPTQAARLRAGTTPGADTQTFTVTVTDGLASASTVVTAVVSPAKLALSTPVSGVDGPVTTVFSNDGRRAYVTVVRGDRVLVMNTATGDVVSSIDVGTAPEGIAISPDGSRVYVASVRGGISVIDTASGTTLPPIAVPDGSTRIAVSPDGTRAYVANFYSSTVSVVDLSNNTLITTLTDFHSPLDIIVSRDGASVYVNNISNGPGEVQVLDAATLTVTKIIGSGISGFYPYGLALSPDGAFLYTADISHDNLTVIRTADNTIVDVIPGPHEPTDVSLSPDGSLAYVTSQGNDEVAVVDIATKTTVGSYIFDDHPYRIKASPDGTEIYISRTNAGDISVLSLIPGTNSAPVPPTTPPATTVDHATGTVTGSVGYTDPDGDVVTYRNPVSGTGSNTWTTAQGGTVTVTEDGHYTYTPEPADRSNAYAHPDQNTDSFTLTVSDGHGSVQTITVAVTIDPTGAYVSSSQTPPADGGSVVDVAAGANGQIVTLNRVDDGGSTTWRLSITDSGGQTRTVALGGTPVNVRYSSSRGPDLTVAPNGQIYQSVANSDGTYSVAVVDVDGSTHWVPLSGEPASPVVFGADNRAYVITAATVNAVTMVTAINPDGSFETLTAGSPLTGSHSSGTGNAEHPDAAPVVIGRNGYAYITRADSILVFHPDGTTQDVAIPTDFEAFGQVAIGPDGTPYQALNGHFGTTTVIVKLSPTGDLTQVGETLEGAQPLTSGLAVAADGSVYANVFLRSSLSLAVAVFTPGGATSVASTPVGGSITPTADGRTFVVDFLYDSTGRPQLGIDVYSADDVKVASIPVSGNPLTITSPGDPTGSYLAVTAEGNAYLLTQPDNASPTRVTIVHPDNVAQTVEIPGRVLFNDPITDSAGRLYMTAIDDFGHNQLVVVDQDGSVSAAPLAGTPQTRLRVALDGRIYVTVSTADGDYLTEFITVAGADPVVL